MKKNRLLSLLLVVIMALGLVIPAAVTGEEVLPDEFVMDELPEEFIFDVPEEEVLEEEPVEEEPVAEEELVIPVIEEEPAAEEEPVEEEEPAEEEDLPEELPEEEIPVEIPEEIPAQEEEIDQRFSQGYVKIEKGTEVFTAKDDGEILGEFAEDAVVYAIRKTTEENADDDWLKIVFDTAEDRAAGNDLPSAYIRMAYVTVLTEAEQDALLEELAADEAVRYYKTAFAVPAAAFIVAEEKQEEAAEPAEEEESNATAAPSVKPAKPTGAYGKTTTLTASSAKDPSSWRWEINKGDSWVKITKDDIFTTVSKTQLKIAVSESYDFSWKIRYRIKVGSDKDWTNSSTVTVKPAFTTSVNSKTADFSFKKGMDKEAGLTAGASIDVTAYQWKVSTDGGATWKFMANADTVGNTKAAQKLRLNVTDAHYGRKYKCKITTAKGWLYGPVVTIAKPFTTYANNKTTDSTIKKGIGKTVSIPAKASETVDTYKWYVSYDDGATWKALAQADTVDSTKAKATLKIAPTEATMNAKYRCLITIGDNKAYTPAVKIANPFTAKLTRKTGKVAIGSKGEFTASGTGTSGTVKFSWEQSKDGGKTWSALNKTNAKYTVTASYAVYTYKYRCLVSDDNGGVYTSASWLLPTNCDDFNYKLSDDGSYYILTGFKSGVAASSKKNLVLPAGYKGIRVKQVEKSAFKNETDIVTLVVPRQYLALKDSAFEDCSKMTKVTITNYVNTIGKACFKNCSKLANMETTD